jgi:PilZ domain
LSGKGEVSRGKLQLGLSIQSFWPLRCDIENAVALSAGVWVIRANSSVERRKWSRLPLAIPVFVRSCDEKGNEFLEFATALNISAAGALLAVRRLLPTSAQLLLEIPSAPLAATAKLPKASRTLRAKSVRVTHADGYHLVAVKFSRPLLADAKEGRATQRKDDSAHVKRFSPTEVPSSASK